jgi:NAD(P)-dependent dehydrogenase (short-subunit alcohol dehydrogenase family)
MNVSDAHGELVALVTGAASGIGKATALLFAQRGHRVVAVDRNAGGLQTTLAAADALGGAASDSIAACTADILDPLALAAAVDLAADRFGGLDVLVAAAAIGDCGRIDEMKPQLWDLIIDVILKGSSHCCRAAIPAMRQRGGGSIVLFGSILGRAGPPGIGAYAAAKGGIEALARTLAVDLAPDRIRVNCIVPGAVDTPMTWSTIPPEDHSKVAGFAREDIPVGRMAQPVEIARCVYFLASDEASFVNGTSLVADGGVLAKLASRI